MRIIHKNITDSTNDDLKESQYCEGDVVWAEFQRVGRGQRGHKWSSNEGENLMFSVLLCPTFLPTTKQFYICQIVAIAIVEALAKYHIDAKIKWTNDIYVGDKKLVGILIEHIKISTTLQKTIVGIGINVNQTTFSPDIPNPTSMKLLTNMDYNREEVLKSVLDRIEQYYKILREGKLEDISKKYHSLLYRLNEKHIFADPKGEKWLGSIRGVKEGGELIVENEKGEIGNFAFKQIEFVI